MSVHVLETTYNVSDNSHTVVNLYDTFESMCRGIASDIAYQYDDYIVNGGMQLDIFESEKAVRKFVSDFVDHAEPYIAKHFGELNMSFSFTIERIETEKDNKSVEQSLEEIFEALQNQ